MITVYGSDAPFSAVAAAQARAYPRMRAQDFIKLAYQHARGCEHMVRFSPEIARRIAEEREGAGVRFEDIGGGLVRAHLAGEENPLSTPLLAAMFACSAREYRAAENGLETALAALSALAESGEIPVSGAEMARALREYRAAGCPAVHHSEAFRAAYQPHYRVLMRVFADYCALFRALEALKARKPGAIVAIDGMCASGKTTLARAIAGVLDANVYHMDDFFLPPERRTPQRLGEIGGNVDRERFLSEVLAPLAAGKAFAYRPFDCASASLRAPVESRPGALNIVEGAYSCHPELRDYYDLTVCLTIDESLQLARVRARNGETMLKRFQNEWIPMENRFLAAREIPGRADFCYHICGGPAAAGR